MADEYRVTAEALEQMKSKLQELRSTGRSSVAEKIKEARSFGDLSENSEYDAAKAEQAKLESQISELEYEISHAVIIDESSIDVNAVYIGCSVKLFDEKYQEEDVYKVRGSGSSAGAAFDPDVIFDDSPIGKAILSHRVGDKVDVSTPDGKDTITILAIIKD